MASLFMASGLSCGHNASPVLAPSVRTGAFSHGGSRCYQLRRQRILMSRSPTWSQVALCNLARNKIFCKNRRLGSPLIAACSRTDDDYGGEKFMQYRRHLQKTIQAVLKILDGNSIFLTGMMGCGKSTIGEILARDLNYGFADSDTRVEKLSGFQKVADIFAEIGEKGFREEETKALRELCTEIKKRERPLVVALGGGAVVKPENWIIAEYGIVVYIDVPPKILAKRVIDAGLESRPLFPPDCTEIEAEELLSELYNERELFYREADIRVPIQDLSTRLEIADASAIPQAMVAFEVLKKIEKHGGRKKIFQIDSNNFH